MTTSSTTDSAAGSVSPPTNPFARTHYGQTNSARVGHAYPSKYGGRSLCGRAEGSYSDQLTAKRPARICRWCAKILDTRAAE